MDKWDTHFKELLTEQRQIYLETTPEETNENVQTNYIHFCLNYYSNFLKGV